MNRIGKTISFVALLLCSGVQHGRLLAASFNDVMITSTAVDNEVVPRYQAILQSEIQRYSAVPVVIKGKGESIGKVAPHGLVVYLHTSASLAERQIQYDGGIPSERDPGPEGFVLVQNGNETHIIGVDTRGVLYGIGELLRQLEFQKDSIVIPDDLEIRSAPAFEVRGTGVSQGHTITELTGSRKWTPEEWERAVVGYALAGANTFSIGHDANEKSPTYQFIRGLGLKVLLSMNPNSGAPADKPEWEAQEAIGRHGYLCLSVPEAREYKLMIEERRWRDLAPVDYVRLKSGDGGGCECELCRPYGAVYIEMCHDIAEIIHRYQPETEIFVLNQKLDNDGDLAIFKYLREHPEPWLRAIAVGPGSNAMGWMPGRRQDHRMDLFRYPAFGAMDRYYREMLQQMPPQHDLVFFTDITHWVYAQNGLMGHYMLPDRNHNVPPTADHYIYDRKPDRAMYRVYNRRAFNARPEAYYDFFRESERYGIGDVTYSEGNHDHFNNWMWQRLLWAPDVALREIVLEYCQTFFGLEAAPLMVDAIFQFERNMQIPIEKNKGIQEFANLVERAGMKIPKNRLQADWLWRQYQQRAYTDLYIQADVRAQEELLSKIKNLAEEAVSSNETKSKLQEINGLLIAGPQLPKEATDWVKRSHQLGRESDRIYGVQIAGMYNLKQDYVGLGWYTDQIEAASVAKTEEARSILQNMIDYEMKRVDALYDDVGNPDNSPHVTYGWPYDGGFFDKTVKKSQRVCAYTTNEEQGVTLEYKDLDPEAQYVVRMTLARPVYKERYQGFHSQQQESIFADDVPLVENMTLPEFTPRQFEFEIPRQSTVDGKLKLWCQKQDRIGEGDLGDVTVWRNTGGWGTLLSEVWLYKKAE
ncbi:hypothetical protein Pla110_21090 [Polystyrenella longa]|uniref:Alpha glucuronidase N-terminal domain-containing protein n=1 Tax=Polystyrenella longa TaxID=2528007 RepID=A0A518CMC0_9PLAN|nr:hypothetical protein [Polystyrenella longa]QDU80380.1 hypothetical protein Pla110_21090 [Polystyrenella longa]